MFLQFPVRAFLTVCETHTSPVFLADPGVLHSLGSSLVDSVDTDQLFKSVRIISFGVLESQWTGAQKVFKIILNFLNFCTPINFAVNLLNFKLRRSTMV